MAKYAGRGRNASVRLTLVYCVLLTLSAFARPQKPCVRFSFPTLPSDHRLRAVVGSTISVPFKLDTSQCPAGWLFRVDIIGYYVYAKKPQGDDYCAVRLTREGCVSTNKGWCPCLDGGSDDNGAAVVKKVTAADSGSWSWRTGDGTVREEIILDVQEGVATTEKGPEMSTKEAGNSGGSPPQKGQMEADNVIGKKDDEDDHENDGFVDSSMKTGLVVGGANIVTFIFIALVVFLCRRKREKRGRRPSEKLLPLPTDVTEGEVMTPSQRLANDVGSSTTLDHYEEIPAPFDNDTYLQPVVIVNREESSYTPLV